MTEGTNEKEVYRCDYCIYHYICLVFFSGVLFPIDREWYDALQKPDWTPSGSVIGIIWAVLFALISLSAP